MLKVKRLFIGLIPFLLSGSLLAYLQPEGGSFGITGEYLYLCASLDDTYFVINSETGGNPQGSRIGNNPGFHSGFRLEGAYAFCCNCFDARVRWSHLNFSSNESSSGAFLFNTAGFPPNGQDLEAAFFSGTASSEIDIHYNTLEGLLGLPLLLCDPFEVFFRFGLQYSYVSFKNDIFYSSATPLVSEEDVYQARFWGVGPELALEGHYLFCDFNRWCWCSGSFSLVGLASVSLLAANCRAKFFSYPTNGDADTAVKDEEIWRMVPYGSIRFGLNHAKCIKCVAVALEIGYEFDYFVDCFSNIRFVNDLIKGISFNDYTQFALQGPYVSLSLVY